MKFREGVGGGICGGALFGGSRFGGIGGELESCGDGGCSCGGEGRGGWREVGRVLTKVLMRGLLTHLISGSV